MDDMTRPGGGFDNTAVGVSENAKSSSTRQDDADEINLADYLRVISKYRRMIFWICAVTVIVTAAISMFLPKLFAATASVVPPVDSMQRDFGVAEALGAAEIPMLRQIMDTGNISEMYAGILKSRSVADALIEKFNLAEVYRIQKYVSDVRKELERRTSIKVASDGIIAITVEDRDPCRAAALANAYVEELDNQNRRLFVGQAASKKAFFEKRLKEIQTELSNYENIQSREARIKEILFEMLTKEYEMAKIEVAKSMPTIQVLDRAVTPEKMCKPKRMKITLLAGIASLFVAFLAAFFREHLSRAPLNRI